MFGFSKKQPQGCPIDPRMRLWMENAFLWLASEFGHEYVITKKMLHPTPEHFPIRFDGSTESMIRTAEIVAKQMDIDINEVNLDTYEQNIQEFTGDFGHRIWTEVDKESEIKLSAGVYFDKNENGKYDIFIERKNLHNAENLVATLAHEFSHIKILGEKRLDFNDEQLTDLTPVIFGLGIFNANSAFTQYKSIDSFGHNEIGYLKQREWGYALALYAHFRQEVDPNWIKFLTPNIRSDFNRSMHFINNNQDKIFIEKYEPE